ncbi:hypothetical protein HGRIS_003514 [Hohenbuehelia grisea]|uniref:Cytochrome P450 n=1 Tax=Hohenbuehelia grisea TaxID=104357 RepID=A0ABR3JGQ6_9AGAR
MSIIVWTIISGLFVFVWYKSRTSDRGRLPLPPGPPADPVIGHLRVIPPNDFGSVFHEWGKAYGDVVYINALGTSLLVLDSVGAAIDLLEKKSSIYSDRPIIPTLTLLGYTPNLSLLPYGKQFQVHRKILHSNFTRSASLQWQGLQTSSAQKLAKALIANGQDYDRLFSWYTTAITTRIAYGFDIQSEEDEYVKLSELNSFVLNAPESLGVSPVDVFPIWLPRFLCLNDNLVTYRTSPSMLGR